MIITDGVLRAAARTPDRPAIVCAGQTLTYRALAQEIEALVPRLSGLARVGIEMRNHPDSLIAFLAAVRAGSTAMVLNPSWPDLLRRQILELHAPACIVATRDDVPSAMRPVIVPPASAHFLMGFTSGTTGLPKAFVRTHASWLATFAAMRAEFGEQAAQGVLAPGPLCHSLTLYGAVETLEAGGTLHIQAAFDAKACLDLLGSGAIASMYGVPAMYDLLCAAAGQPIERAFAVISAGAKLSANLRRSLSACFPAARVFEYYGASELSFVTLAHADENPPEESVGRAFHGVRLAIRREDGSDLPVGETGTVWVQSPMLSDGYVGPNDDTGFRREGAWATVGDRGALDVRGFLMLAGRENDMLISGGYNVYPQEVERVLTQCAGVRAALVIGVPDARWGQVVTAVVEGEVRRDDLMAACAAALPQPKWPRRLYRILAMPRTTSGKIARATLMDMLPQLQELP